MDVVKLEWSARQTDDGTWIVENYLGKIVFVGGGKDDVRLACAAPDLLEALKVFVSEYVALVESGDAGFWNAEDEQKVINARAAIAKAEGRSP